MKLLENPIREGSDPADVELAALALPFKLRPQTRTIFQHGHQYKYKRGEQLNIVEGKSLYLYLILEGRVLAYRNSIREEDLALFVARSGEFIGDLSRDKPSIPTTLYIAMKDCKVLRISVSSAFQLLKSSRFAEYYSTQLCRQVEAAYTTIQSLTSHTVFERLLLIFDREGEKKLFDTEITVHFTHEQLASLIGADREFVSDNITRMRNEGIIVSKARRGLIVLNKGVFEEALDKIPKLQPIKVAPSSSTATSTLSERLLLFFRTEGTSDSEGSIVLFITHEELANRMGTIRQVITHYLTEMKHRGIVIPNRRKRTIFLDEVKFKEEFKRVFGKDSLTSFISSSQ